MERIVDIGFDVDGSRSAVGRHAISLGELGESATSNANEIFQLEWRDGYE